jgi:hypothetical protein
MGARSALCELEVLLATEIQPAQEDRNPRRRSRLALTLIGLMWVVVVVSVVAMLALALVTIGSTWSGP